MNIGDLANFTRRKDLFTVRQERIKREGSPYYTWKVPVTAASATSVMNPESQFPEARKYFPLDWLEIANNDAVDLTLVINSAESIPVPAGTIRTIDNLAVRFMAVTNDDPAAPSTLGKIIVTLQRQPLTIDKWARRQG